MPRPTRFDWLFRPQVADRDLPLSAETRFAEVLAELPAVERSVLALSEIGGLDTNEIAERLGTDPAIVRKLLARGRESVRTSLATRGRRGLTALLPFQTLWQVGSSAPSMRAAGLVAAAVVAPTVAIGGAGTEAPRAPVTRPGSPVVRALEWSERTPLARSRARVVVGGAAASAVTRRETAAVGERRSARPAARVQTSRDALPAPSGHERSPAAPPPIAKPETIARTLPLPVELPVVPPKVSALPVELPVPAPELPKPPQLP